MTFLGNLSPALLWTYFEEICKIPRLSKNEGKIREYLLAFAKKNNLDHKEDSVGNILITRSASPGMEKKKTVVLQSHMDMVGEKNADHPHNWDTDPIIPKINNGWVTASGTTLGADDGIGIAAQMAILTDSDLIAGKIECLFTVDEESGMTGALNLQPDFFSGNVFLNLDSEDEGILYIGCAGGMDTVGTLRYEAFATPQHAVAFEISIKGLHGGHSGDEIHKGYGNAVKLMSRLLSDLTKKYDIAVAWFDGGNLRNAIPREAFATIITTTANSGHVKSFAEAYSQSLTDEFGELEKDLTVNCSSVKLPQSVMERTYQDKLLSALNCCPHGVIAWSKEMNDLVETSTNLAITKFEDNNIIKIITTQRSSVESSKNDASNRVEECLKKAGAVVVHSDGYPGWKPDLNSEILKITRDSYKRLFGREPEVKAIHAGLECGLVYEKIKGIDIVSFGPTIKGAHTPEETIEIITVKMFWDLLIDVLHHVPDEA